VSNYIPETILPLTELENDYSRTIFEKEVVPRVGKWVIRVNQPKF
jgi:hypothetical protein